MNLDDIRIEIDDIDKALLNLLCKRLDCSRQVAEYKVNNQIPVLNQRREDEIIARIKEEANQYDAEYGNIASIIYSTIMDGSRALQYQYMDTGAELRALIQNAETELAAGDNLRVVCQGKAGSYSHIAAKQLFSGVNPSFVTSFGDVFECVNDGGADYGILPIENSVAGSVNEVYDLVMQYKFTIAAAVEVPVHHCLVAKKGVRLSDITEVYSHPQALSQCSDFIKTHKLSEHRQSNTAVAAAMVATSEKADIAAIASKETAEIYGLEILQSGIQNSEDNRTRFIAISKKPVITKNANKISIMFSLPHVTGSLYRTLSRFSMTGLNMTKLESRPIKEGNKNTFTYIFYLDFEGTIKSQGVLKLLGDFYEETENFTFLGHYEEQ